MFETYLLTDNYLEYKLYYKGDSTGVIKPSTSNLNTILYLDLHIMVTWL